MEFKRIVRENRPCWYELSWQEKPSALILRIHQNFIKKIDFDFIKSPIVKSLMEGFKFDEFGGDFGNDIGFGKIFKRNGEKDQLVEFLVRIPRIKKFSEEKCRFCDGKKKDEYGEKCLSCGGTGKEYFLDWKPALAISASFSAFTSLLNWQETDTSASYPQLLTLETITREGMHGGSLSGEISIPLRQWLLSLGNYHIIPEMVQAMKISYNRMIGPIGRYERFTAQARENGGFTADCPGDACGLYPSNWDMDERKGYDFSCHNVDTPMQQITLIAGLAALHDRARKEIKQ